MSRNNKELKKEFTGFNISERDKQKIEAMTDYLYDEGFITTKSIAETCRWCLSFAWLGIRTRIAQLQNQMGTELLYINIEQCKIKDVKEPITEKSIPVKNDLVDEEESNNENENNLTQHSGRRKKRIAPPDPLF